MQWTDRIRQVKVVLVIMAILLSVASLVVSHYLVRDLKTEEKTKMKTWAEAMRSLGKADENTDMSLVLQVLNSNNTIPVVVYDQTGQVQMQRNIEGKLPSNSNPIRIHLSKTEWLDVCYDDSLLLKRLALWPYVQLGAVMVFVVIAIFALLSSKRAEQNKVWVGLSKETAHQLGTPISSLMAWVEVLRETYPEDELLPEMNKDVKRLQLIAERFSKIGSKPELKSTDLCQVVQNVVTYIGRRAGNHITISAELPGEPVMIMACAPLFEWVIENLSKNAIDAMQGHGSITITLKQEPYCTAIEVTDTGKGIASGHFNDVFKPGFTTKSRGWGLGLSLAKRIIEEYHKGRIFVKCSELGVGTTFRIEVTRDSKIDAVSA